ncbi:MAG: head decoration protein [Spirochaetes bacterium]|nr:head decoration protein [Spirochaetota bacterium]
MPETYVPDNLGPVGSFPVITDSVTILTGQGILTRGTVLGKITASGKYIKSLSGASDGSQTPACILAETVDATSADAPAVVYLSGEFSGAALILGTAHTIATVKAAFRALSIFIKTTLAA